MENNRITSHPILTIPEKDQINFKWEGKNLFAKKNDTISAALIANDIHIFNHHPKTNSPQGIFCANGQCAQCMVLVNGISQKACMTIIEEGMCIEKIVGNPSLIINSNEKQAILEKKVKVLIIGGGPAGMSAAKELADKGIAVLLIDDKATLGGKLTLQTHRFFGSVEDVHAGKRGFEIGELLQKEIKGHPLIDVWTETTCIAVFSDKKIGVLKNNIQYVLIEAEAILFATGAREKSLKFPGNTLPGIFGAGAFQTLLNRDLVRPGNKVVVIGGGNVGLIAAYHALQANIKVAALLEASPFIGGYQVHFDKLRRLGVPIFTSHSIIQAFGKDHVNAIEFMKVNQDFKPISDTNNILECDTVLLAVGLNPVNELSQQAKNFGLNVFEAGDCKEIAEASAAIFSGKMVAIDILNSFGYINKDNIKNLKDEFNILKSKPGGMIEEILPNRKKGVYPVFHCIQEIPCNPCTQYCPYNLIQMDGTILNQPYITDYEACIGCGKCLVNCSGLAISLVDYRKSKEFVKVSIPSEFPLESINQTYFTLVDIQGYQLGSFQPIKHINNKKNNKTQIIEFEVPFKIAEKVIGFRLPFYEENPSSTSKSKNFDKLDSIVCRCEQVTEDDIRLLIKSGIKDFNQIKAITRAGMGACQSKTCESLIYQIMREEEIPVAEITPFTKRPLFIDVPFKHFTNPEDKNENKL